MIRKLILSTVLATATLTGLSMTPSTAEAAAPSNWDRGHERDRDRGHERDRDRDFRREYEVLVECGHRWENRGTYRDRDDAERAAQRLRHEGFRVEIREC